MDNKKAITERKRGKRSAEAAEETRRAILAAAGRHFAAEGFGAASLRDIGDSAGTTHGVIRHHFGTKDDLWKAVVDDFIGQVAARQLPLFDQVDDKDPIELLKTFTVQFMRQTAEMPEVAKLMLKESGEPGPHLDYLAERILPVHELITPVFKRVQKAGYLTEHDPDSFFIFLVMLGSIPFAIAPFTNKFYRDDIASDAGIDAHIDRVLSTLFPTTT
ncbi:MAG: TetR/AcrR family transcriptional regulator [Candidatus Phaeomarinobacter sp.]